MKYITRYSIIILSLLLSVILTNCNGVRSEQGQNTKTNKTQNQHIEEESTLEKVVFFVESSGSMYGYVNGYTEYIDVLSELSEKPQFVETDISKEFYFVSSSTGSVSDLNIYEIGDNANIFKENLNLNSFRAHGGHSALNEMFKLTLSRAKDDTISIFITDAIYDIASNDSREVALNRQATGTRSYFIERLKEGDIQTIVLKISSSFNGTYYCANGSLELLDQIRPFYIWIFGNSKLLNEYFDEEYFNSLSGYENMVRFLLLSDISIPYQIVTINKKGSFRFDRNNKNKLNKVKSSHNNFQFSFVVDFSNLPFSKGFYLNKDIYDIEKNNNYQISKIDCYNDGKLPGVDWKPTHILSLESKGNIYGKINLSLNNIMPSWIEETNIDSDNNIRADTSHTFGFSVLINSISEAYDYFNKSKPIANFEFEINN